MEEFKLVLQATLKIYVECAKDATLGFMRNWVVILASIAMIFIFMLTAGLVGGMGMAGGFLLGLVVSFFTGQYYSYLSATVRKDKLKYQDLYEFDASMFFAVIGVSFILFIVHLILSPMGVSDDSRPILMLVYFFIVFAFNALPEVIYIHRYDSTLAFSEALKFTKENWIEWYLPYVALLLPVFLLVADPVYLLFKFALLSPLFPGVIILETWSELLWKYRYLGVFIGFLLAHWFMLFRGFLFKELSTGTRRRRVYQAKQK